MSNQRHFWRNVALIALVHAIAIVGLVRWNSAAAKQNLPSVVWLSGDAADNQTAASGPTALIKQSLSEAEPTPTPDETPEEPSPVLVASKSEIELPAPTPTPTATPTATPRPISKPVPTPEVKVPKATPRPPRKPHPKPTPRPTPKPTPKPKKTILAKASPRPSISESADDDRDDKRDEPDPAAANEAIRPSNASSPSDSASSDSGTGSGATTNHGKAMVKASELAAFGKMLHDRLYSEWIQPTTAVSSEGKISTLVRVRIEKDGTISKFEIVKSSGNVMIDESVAAIGKHVTQVDPLPRALRGSGGHYDVKINFELNSD
jgi:TonB family protein